MKKWITSNYHYMVPEIDETTKVKANFVSLLSDVKRGIAHIGSSACPVILGPVSLVHFAKITHGTKESLLQDLIPVYAGLLKEISALGVQEIQIQEPALVFADDSLLGLYKSAYPEILPSGPRINMVSFMDDVGDSNYQWLISEPMIHVVSLDFTRGKSFDLIQKYGFPADKVLGAGLVDSRNVWRLQPERSLNLLTQLKAHAVNLRIRKFFLLILHVNCLESTLETAYVFLTYFRLQYF
jgi:5-methyltetrahydropteroyltriglutamate--homocysteine methyltransferase